MVIITGITSPHEPAAVPIKVATECRWHQLGTAWSLVIALRSDCQLNVGTMGFKIFAHLHLRCFFQMVTPEKYEVKGSIQEAAIILTSCTEPKMQVTITLTSPVIREENGRDGGWEIHHSLSHCTSFLVFLLSFYEISFSMLVDTLKSTVLLALHKDVLFGFKCDHLGNLFFIYHLFGLQKSEMTGQPRKCKLITFRITLLTPSGLFVHSIYCKMWF